MGTIAGNIQSIREEVDAACRLCGRSVDDVRIMGVSKRQPIEKIYEAYEAGLRLFGENRVQEAREKWSKRLPDIEIHFIGHLQRNKAREAVQFFDEIQSIDRAVTARELSKRIASAESKVIMPVLLEMNTSGEDSKSGVSSEDALLNLVDDVLSFPNLEIRGLMTIAPFVNDEKRIRVSFRKLREVRDRLQARYRDTDFSELSMGMSGDFPLAIGEGSTLVRIGTRLFGDREAL